MERIDVKKEVIETNDPGGTCQEHSQSNYERESSFRSLLKLHIHNWKHYKYTCTQKGAMNNED